MVSSKTAPEDLNRKLRSKFNLVFISYDCLHGAILKVLYGKGKWDYKVSQFLFHNIQNDVVVFFEILKMLKKYMKFTREACWIKSKISNRDINSTLMIFLCCDYCCSLLCCYYERCLILRNFTSWSCLSLTD